MQSITQLVMVALMASLVENDGSTLVCKYRDKALNAKSQLHNRTICHFGSLILRAS